MNKDQNQKNGSLFNSLTPEQQRDLLLAADESNDPNNLISHEEVKKEIAKWLEAKSK